ncbi:hypothetical protein [Streptomyces sp. CT34]|uniref:hypothetical protein n=1 Tax=Streptomyces sp. CT34 TaxID=1553907 RepID=UPI0005BE478F|nr:hypothetical protein [Streptomyces sp. CT34]
MSAPDEVDFNPIGVIGRVTVSIPSDGPGEVLLPVRGGSEAFAAWSGGRPIARHTQVIVTDRTSARSVIVVPLPAL